MTRILKLVGAIAGLALVAGLVLLAIRLEGQRRTEALRADSVEAALDTTKLRGETWERRAKQFLLRATVAEDSLKLKPKTSISIKLKVDTLHRDTILGAPVQEVEGVRSSTIDYQHQVAGEPPVSIRTTAELPPAGQPGRLLNTRIGISPIALVPRVSCSREKFNGIHRAHVTIDSLPRWITPEIREAQSDDQVCNPRGRLRISLGTGWKWAAGVGIVGILIGAFAVPD